ncbi:MAG: 30S ribosomal protein S13 [Candidatus Pacearchaeota archaeon]
MVLQEKQVIKEEKLIRILDTDIPGNKNVYTGLTKIKGISWSFSNALCRVLNINKNKKVSELTEQDIRRIIDFVKNPTIPDYLKNRQKDLESGANSHLLTTKLDLQREFDIKRLKKIRSYRGLRHSLGQPVRGQRTRSHFRKIGRRAVGVKTSKSKSSTK